MTNTVRLRIFRHALGCRDVPWHVSGGFRCLIDLSYPNRIESVTAVGV
ncbi:MAG: hypothetical protein NHB32_24565 [Fischerella sp. CENA71]|nr:hypothetical protein [Fischerella sp. CENA71]